MVDGSVASSTLASDRPSGDQAGQQAPPANRRCRPTGVAGQQAGQERAVERIAGARRIDGLDRVRGDRTGRLLAIPRTLRPEFPGHFSQPDDRLGQIPGILPVGGATHRALVSRSGSRSPERPEAAARYRPGASGPLGR